MSKVAQNGGTHGGKTEDGQSGPSDFRIPGGVSRRIQDVGLAAWAVYTILCEDADPDGRSQSSRARLATILGVNRRTVTEAIRKLIAAGLVVAEERRDLIGARIENDYVVVGYPPRRYAPYPLDATAPPLDATLQWGTYASNGPVAAEMPRTNAAEPTPLNGDDPHVPRAGVPAQPFSEANVGSTNVESVEDPLSLSLRHAQISTESDSDSVDAPPKKAPPYTADFEERFWAHYPPRQGRRIGKKEAFAEWRRLSHADRDAAVGGLESYKADPRVGAGYVLDASRYLKRRRWEDEQVRPGTGRLVTLLGHSFDVMKERFLDLDPTLTAEWLTTVLGEAEALANGMAATDLRGALSLAFHDAKRMMESERPLTYPRGFLHKRIIDAIDEKRRELHA
jgi:hypothetical protein